MNDHNSMRISTCTPRTWRILLFRSTLIEIDRYDGGVLLKELGDLYFLFHNFGVQSIPFRSFFFNLSEGKKYIANNVHKAPYPCRDVNYDLENSDSRNFLSRRRCKLSDFSINYVGQCSIWS